MSSHGQKSGELILSIDAGTQSIRAGLVDPAGNIHDLVKTVIVPYFSERPGWAEQDPEYYWKMLCQTCLELLAKTRFGKDSIKAVTMACQRSTYVNVDKEGKPLRPAIVWLDQRRADARKIVPSPVWPLLKIAGLADFMEFAVGFCRSNWIRQNQPEIWDKTHKYLFLSGFFTHRLTGEFADSVGNMIGTIPFNSKTHEWAGNLDFKWKIFPLEREKLPEIVPPSRQIGVITKAASRETGIPEGLPFFAASNDKACEIIGAGCQTPETLCISFGTTATINAQISKYVELRSFMPPFPSAIPGQYYTEASVMRGLWMVTWFKEEFGLQERLEAMEGKATPEQLLENLIKDVPPGSMGLMLQPYWTPGVDMSASAKGSVIGFGDVHTRAHLYRAIIEGLSYALKEGAILTEKKTKTPMQRVRVSGGGSQSDSIVQIAADVFGVPAERPHTHETSALGAAIDAAVGMKMHGGFPEAIKAMTRVGKVFEPIDKNVEIYDRLFNDAYLKLYGKLLPLFEKIRDITGYPE